MFLHALNNDGPPVTSSTHKFVKCGMGLSCKQFQLHEMLTNASLCLNDKSERSMRLLLTQATEAISKSICSSISTPLRPAASASCELECDADMPALELRADVCDPREAEAACWWCNSILYCCSKAVAEARSHGRNGATGGWPTVWACNAFTCVGRSPPGSGRPGGGEGVALVFIIYRDETMPLGLSLQPHANSDIST